MSIPILGQQPDEPAPESSSGPLIRLLFCFNCKSLEELPDYEGRSEDDHLLAVLLERHHFAGIPHKGHLFKVPLKAWTSPEAKEQIVRQIKTGSGGISELDIDFYDTKATFQEDALKCFNEHLRPKGQCSDYGSASKALVPKTAAERKEAGLAAPSKVAPKAYLCQFCPVHVYNVQKQRSRKGLYR